MKDFCKMSELELLDTFDCGVFSADEIKNAEWFEQIDTKDITDNHSYWLTTGASGCLNVGSVGRKNKVYHITVNWTA